MVSALVPMPSMSAPMATRNRARSCTWGSDAALRSTVVPRAAVAAIRAFSVPVTLGSSRKISAPLRCLASTLYSSPTVTSAPSCSSARKCVSTRRRPITSPPGGGRVTLPKRASIGPASRIDARMRAESTGSTARSSADAVSTATALGPVHWASAPRWRSRSSMVSTSRMRGTLSMRQTPLVSSVAARMGSAAFLFPAGRIVPFSGRPPVTQNIAAIGGASYGAACFRVKRSRTFALVQPALSFTIVAAAAVAAIAAGWAGATAGARGEWAALARSPLGQLGVAVARWTAVAVVTTAIVWLAVRRLAPLASLWVPLAAAAGTLAAAAAGDRRDGTSTAERGMAAGMTVVAVALLAVFFHPRQTVGGASVGWHYWLVMTPTLGAVFGLAAVGGARIADKLPLPRGLADLGLLVLAAGVGAATTVSPFVVCGLAAGAAMSAAPDSPLRATLATHAPVWRSILALCAGLWLTVPSVWLLAPAVAIA